MTGLRNIAIIAHVDHGKTSLIDQLLRQSGSFRAGQKVAERVMDSGALERERGITILAKCASVAWKGVRINLVDTPGHADFGGEVERILSMVEGVLVLVDAAEGPMPQTKFVTAKALALGLRPIVVVNKVDRPDQRAGKTEVEVFDLFAALGASDEQLDFPTLYASAKEGWAAESLSAPRESMNPLFDLVLRHVPAPEDRADAPFALLATILENDTYLGRVLIGRVTRGIARANAPVVAVGRDGGHLESARLTKLLAFRGVERIPVEEVAAGDIVAVAGLKRASVADTIADPGHPEPLAARPIDPPTLSMRFSTNDSPLAGNDGDKLTSRMLGARLHREAEGNVAIEVDATEEENVFEVRGRGELQLGVLVETMRREGFELSLSRPKVLYRTDRRTGRRLEPIEEVVIDVDDEFAGAVIAAMGDRHGEMQDMSASGGGKTRLVFLAPSRGLVGWHGKFLNETRGTGVMTRVFDSHGPLRGPVAGRRTGVLVANAAGRAVPYALANLEERGELFIGGGTPVYEGMIVGEHGREGDLAVNVLKTKKLTNIRAAGSDEAIRLTPPRRFRLEDAMGYIEDDELVEVTPNHVRLRKRVLDAAGRRRDARRLRAAAETA